MLPVSATPNQEMGRNCDKKRQNGGWISQKALRVQLRLNGADICGEGTGHFRSSGEQKWKLNWSEQKKLRGVIAPISTPNDYLETVVDDVVSPRWSKKKCPPTVPSEKLQLDGILSLRVKSFLTRLQERNAICRSPRQIETYSLG